MVDPRRVKQNRVCLWYNAYVRGGPAMNREGKPVSAARIRNASADLKEILKSCLAYILNNSYLVN